MINVPYDMIIKKIVESAKISQVELEAKIKTKLESLSGLISKEGAAHIVANELGVNLLQTQGLMKISDLLSGMKKVDVVGKVIRKYEIRTFENDKRSGKIGKFLLGDESGTTMVVLWNDKADLSEKVNEGDIIKATETNIRENNGRSEIHLSDESELEINPQGIEIEVKQTNSYAKAERKKIVDLKENDTNVEIFCTIVQVFDPKFFEIDATTGKRIRREEGATAPKNATYGAVLNVFADDGSDNIRVVLWKNQILNLLKVNEVELMQYQKDPSSFEKVKTELLGVMVKFIGRVVQNQLYGRLEMVANVVLRDVNPEEELAAVSTATTSAQPVSPQKTDSNPQSTEVSEQKTEIAKKPAEPQKVESSKAAETQSVDLQNAENDDELDEELLSLEDLEDLDD